MFWGSRTSSYNVVTFWLKLASTFYALFLFILARVHDKTAMLLVQFFLPQASDDFVFTTVCSTSVSHDTTSTDITSPSHFAPAAPGRRCYGQHWWAPGIFT